MNRIIDDHLYQVLIEQMSDGAAAIGSDGSILYSNSRLAALLRTGPDDLIGRSLLDFAPANHNAVTVVRLLADAGAAPSYADASLAAGDGSVIPVHLSAASAVLNGDRVLCLTVTDLTDRTRAEAERAQLASIVESASDLIGMADVGGRIRYINPAGRALLGLGADDDLTSRTIADFHPPEVNRMMREVALPAVAEHGTWQGEHGFRTVDGREFVAWQLLLAHRGAGGDIEFIATIARDLTRRREGEAERHKLATLVEHSTDFIGVADPSGRTVFLNAAGRRLVAFDERGDISSLTIHDFIHPSVAGAIESTHMPALFSTGTWRGETRLRNFRTGEAIPVELDAYLLRDPHTHRPLWLAATARDITERLRTELALQQSHKNLEKMVAERTAELEQAVLAAETANHAKSDFLARMSHEIRTPMNGILGITTLAMGSALTPQQQTFCQMIQESSRALLNVVNELLDFSKIEAGRLDPVRADFSLRDLLDDATALLANQAREKGLTFTLDVAADVPDGLVGDAGWLRQILGNLAGNAIKFTERGSVGIHVHAGPEADGTLTLHIEVRDTGIGIPADRQQSIFEPFAQADASTSRHYGGTGLGLSIAARLADKMQGRIRVDSEPGRGSTFSVDVPLERSRVLPVVSPPAAAPLKDRSEAPAGRGLRVLLAEDNAINQFVAAHLLQNLGHSVAVAKNGREAIELTAAEPFDLILMDVEMPDVDGFAATAAIRQRETGTGRHTPIVALTAHAVKGYSDRCLAAGMDGYISKPIEPADLRRAIAGATAGPGADPADTGEAPAIDRAALLARVGGVPARLHQLAALFTANRPAMLRRIREAAERADGPELARAAHALAGAVGHLGGTMALGLANQLEDTARRGDLSRTPLQLDRLEREVERFDAELADLVGEART